MYFVWGQDEISKEGEDEASIDVGGYKFQL